jgi:PleD family two-component response regulator
VLLSFVVSKKVWCPWCFSLGLAAILAVWRESKEELIKFADVAAYEAKEKGRNKVCFYIPTKTAPAKWLISG